MRRDHYLALADSVIERLECGGRARARYRAHSRRRETTDGYGA